MKQKRILIIDDQPFIRHVIGSELKQSGYQVLEAGNGREGLAVAGAENPDLILLDIMMPVMNGYETCRKLRESESLRRIPIIFLSANAQQSAQLKAEASGADDFTVKSPDTSTLLEKINRLLQSR